MVAIGENRTLVFHFTGGRANCYTTTRMVPRERIELPSIGSKPIILSAELTGLVPRVRVARTSSVCKTVALLLSYPGWSA